MYVLEAYYTSFPGRRRAYVLALAADFCAITGVYTTHVRAYCRSASAGVDAVAVDDHYFDLVNSSRSSRKRDLQYDQMNRAVRVLCGFGQNFLLAAVEVLRIPAPLGVGRGALEGAPLPLLFVGGRLDSTFKWTFCTKPGRLGGPRQRPRFWPC